MTGIQIRLTVVWLWSVSTCVAGEYVTYFNESDQELCVPLHSDMNDGCVAMVTGMFDVGTCGADEERCASCNYR
jgi:hypothetical protein